MRMWQGDATAIDVTWFVANPGAKVLPYDNAFSSRNWDEEGWIDREVGQVDRAPGTYKKGQNFGSYSGAHPCGDASAWLGGVHGITPEIVTDATGRAACCGPAPQTGSAGSGTGGQAFTVVSWPTVTGTGGRALQSGPAWQYGSAGGGTGGLPIIRYGYLQIGTGGTGTGGPAVQDYDVPFIGEIRWISYAGTPSLWLWADGSPFDPSTYPALYAVIGTTWGIDMSTGHPKLPGLQRTGLIGDGGTKVNGPNATVGSYGGVEQVLLSAAESGVPHHTHLVPGYLASYAAGSSAAGCFNGGPDTTTSTTGVTGAPSGSPAVNAHLNYHPVAVMRPIIYVGV